MADVRDDGVSVPPADAKVVPELRQVVADAREHGIDLKIVVIATNPPIDTPLRDIATEVGEAYPGSTVLAMSPTWAGTYSPTFDRVTLEAGQDIAKNGDPVQSSKNFVSELTTPPFPVDGILRGARCCGIGRGGCDAITAGPGQAQAADVESQTARITPGRTTSPNSNITIRSHSL